MGLPLAQPSVQDHIAAVLCFARRFPLVLQQLALVLVLLLAPELDPSWTLGLLVWLVSVGLGLVLEMFHLTLEALEFALVLLVSALVEQLLVVVAELQLLELRDL